MGLIRAAFGAVGSTFSDQYTEVFNCDAMDDNTLVRKGEPTGNRGGSNNRGSNDYVTQGSRINVSEGVCALIVVNGKVIDAVADAGAYTWDMGAAPSCLSGKGFFSGLGDAMQEVKTRFSAGGQTKDQHRVYFVNIKEIKGNKIGIGNVPFRDGEFSLTVNLNGYGVFSYKIANPVFFFQNICGNVTSTYNRSELDFQLKNEIQHKMMEAFGHLQNIPYSDLTMKPTEIAQALTEAMSQDWGGRAGIQFVTFALAGINVDEKSAKIIQDMQQARVYGSNSAIMQGTLVGAQAEAMKTAAGNSNGAMAGFMGMNMAGMAGGFNGNNIQNMGQMQGQNQGPMIGSIPGQNMGQQGQQMQQMQQMQGQNMGQQPQQPMQAPSNTWVCTCGATNSGKFCNECGSKRTEPQSLTCSSCHYTLPEGSNKPKFCPECGQQF